ncbi:LysR family transcriptional regulator [Photobacterium damselae]
MFTLQQLETLILCVECGSFSAAARKLGKAQSAISTAITNLEIDTGIEIFDRSTKIPTLTSHGDKIYRQALKLISHADDIKLMIKTYNSNVEDNVNIAINKLLINENFTNVIDEFYNLHPYTELNITVCEDKDIINLVADGKASIGFMLSENEVPNDIELGVIGYLPISIAVSSSSINMGGFKIHKLKEIRQVLLNGTQNNWNDNFSSALIKTNSLELQLSLIKLGNCWGLIPDHIIKQDDKLTKIELHAEEKNWLLHVDRVVKKEHTFGSATQWIYEQSFRMF